MSDLISLLSLTGQVARTAGQLSQTAGNQYAIDNSGETWKGGAWRNQVQPGSWRGVGFVLDAGELHAGRRLAIHEYPYRDTAWAEDLGKLPRRFNVQAFLVGDDVFSQRDQMVAACEQPGSGTLVHPTLGSVEVVLLDFSVTDRRERGRVVEVMLQFILASDVRFPSSAISTGDAITSAAGALNLASQGDLAGTLDALRIVPSVSKQVSDFTAGAIGAVSDATRALNTVRGMVGTFGRFADGNRMTLQSASATVQGLLSQATTTRSTVVSAAGEVQRLAGLL
jgi:prophage DNA circulation protein